MPGKLTLVPKGLGHDSVPQLPDIWGMVDELEVTGLVVPTAKGYQNPGEHVVEGPAQGKNKPSSSQEADRAHAKLHAR
jgi:hypothetical protein